MPFDSFSLIIIGAMTAGFVQGLSGFAFGMIAMSFWAWTIDPKLVVVMSVFGALSGQLLVAFTVKRSFHKTIVLPFLIGGILGIPIGVMIPPYLDIHTFKVVLGSILIIVCPLMLLTHRLPAIKIKRPFADAIVGGLGGIMSGFGGFPGIIPTLWCTLRGFEKSTQRAVIQNFSLAMLFTTMCTYVATGMITKDMLPKLFLVALSIPIPIYIGNYLYNRISEVIFKKVVLILLFMSGFFLVLSSILSII